MRQDEHKMMIEPPKEHETDAITRVALATVPPATLNFDFEWSLSGASRVPAGSFNQECLAFLEEKLRSTVCEPSLAFAEASLNKLAKQVTSKLNHIKRISAKLPSLTTEDQEKALQKARSLDSERESLKVEMGKVVDQQIQLTSATFANLQKAAQEEAVKQLAIKLEIEGTQKIRVLLFSAMTASFFTAVKAELVKKANASNPKAPEKTSNSKVAVNTRAKSSCSQQPTSPKRRERR